MLPVWELAFPLREEVMTRENAYRAQKFRTFYGCAHPLYLLCPHIFAIPSVVPSTLRFSIGCAQTDGNRRTGDAGRYDSVLHF